LPAVRAELPGSTASFRLRLVQILAWQADEDALPALRAMEKTDLADQETIRWAIARIEAFCPPQTNGQQKSQ
jgi:hypothetical protein